MALAETQVLALKNQQSDLHTINILLEMNRFVAAIWLNF
jgi:hypothetical protein